MIAELYEANVDYKKNKCFTNVKYVFEIKNNSAPLVLLTEFENNPNIQDWEAFKQRITIPPEMEDYFSSHYWDKIVMENKFSIFTQYCSFQHKKQRKRRINGSSS